MDVGVLTIIGDSNGWYWGRTNKLISCDQHQQTNTSRGRGRRGYGDTKGHGNTELYPKL